jgi:hypothetical protein
MENLELNFSQWLAEPHPAEKQEIKPDPVTPIRIGNKLKFMPPEGKVQPTLLRKIQTNEMAATSVVYDPRVKSKEDWNYEGSPGSTGVSPKEWPIGFKPKRKKRGSK